MKNNQILRSPAVSIDTVTLKSDSKGIVDAVPEYKETDKAGIVDTVKNTVEENSVTKVLDEIDLQVLTDQLKDKEKIFDAKLNEFNLSCAQLEEKEKNYRQEIYAELKSEITAEVKESYEDKEKQLIQLIKSIKEKVEADIDGVEDEIISIVFESVSKIIGEQMKNPDSVLSVVRQVMKFTQDRMEMKLRVSIKDYDILQNARDELSAGVSNRVDIVADEYVRYGGCILETAAGRIDGRLEQQLSSLIQVLVNARD